MAVDLHGGGVEVTSREGEGSRFVIRLPMKPTLAVAPAAVAEAPSIADPSDAPVLIRADERDGTR
jgi:hypothetical protein